MKPDSGKRTAAIIPAGGSGTRMGAGAPKQYLELEGVSILMRTVGLCLSCPDVDDLVVSVPAGDVRRCRMDLEALLSAGDPTDSIAGRPGSGERTGAPPRIRVAAGGETRQESVYNGIRAAMPWEPDYFVIHDGVRPFAPPELFSAVIRKAAETGAAIAAVAAVDTLKRVTKGGLITATVPRSEIMQARTPQAFARDLLHRAHEAALASGFQGTDDASLVERLGHPVHVVAGGRRNIKITTPEDLELARLMIRSR